MRPRFVLVAAVFLTFTMAAAGGMANAARRVHHDLTIGATPDPVLAGDPVLIYGQLNQPGYAGQTINLYHHLDGSNRGYTFVGSTTTNSLGFYKFPRADGVVLTNRSWYVTGPGGAR